MVDKVDQDNQTLTPRSQPDLLPILASLPLWQRRILALVQNGIHLYQAAAFIRTSPASVKSAAIPGSPFALALAQAEAGVAIIGRDDARALAIARGGEVVETWAYLLRDKMVAPRDRIQAGRQIAEAAGLVGQPATINVGVQINQASVEERRRLNQRRHQPSTTIVGGEVATRDETPSSEVQG